MQNLKSHLSNREYIMSFASGLFLLVVSLIIQYYATEYANLKASLSVTDIVLSNTRVYDVDAIFVYGPIFLTIFVIYFCVTKPKNFPFVMKSIATFTIIRAVFISLTHINAYPTHMSLDSTFFTNFIFSGIFTGEGLFFSGHTGAPFLLALIFWKDRNLRLIFIGFSILFAVVVLLGHIHYSIDVLSAFFITYSIYHICMFIFKKDFELLEE